MGLKEMKAIAEIDTRDIPRFRDHMKQHGVDVGLGVAWETVPDQTAAIQKCQTILHVLSNGLWDLGQNDIARSVIAQKVKGVTVRHDATIDSDYDYKLELGGSTIAFAANLERFRIVMTGSSKQKSLRSALEGVL